MSTADRAASLADAIMDSAYSSSITCDQLLDLVAAELGHAQILDCPQAHGDLHCLAKAPEFILHIIAGNTAQAGIQSLIRGLLLGSHNRVKLPSSELPELLSFVEALPPNLSQLVEMSTELSDEWLRRSQAVIVFGSDETIQHFRHNTRSDQTFVAHGHRISLGTIFADEDQSAAKRAARDVSLFDQQGCLSPHTFYVANNDNIDPLKFAAKLAGEMERFNQHSPRRPLCTEQNAQITSLRDSYDFRQVNDPSVKLWTSKKSTDWTVIYEADPLFAVSPLNRVIFVKPLPEIEERPKQLFLVKPHLSTLSVHPFQQDYIDQVQNWGASRICPLGKTQQPSLFWHQDGLPQLSPLIKWIDFG